MSEKEKIMEVLVKKNHRVLVIIETMPELDQVIANYLLDGHPMIIGVTSTKHGGIVTLTNGATVTFMVTEPSGIGRYQLVIDKRIKEEEEDELERNDTK